MTPREEAFYLVQHFFIELNIRDMYKARKCAMYVCQVAIKETLDIDRIRHWKGILNEVEKL